MTSYLSRLLVLGALSLFLNLSACSPSKLDSKAFVRYIQNPSNGLLQGAKSGFFNLKAQYVPPALSAQSKIKSNGLNMDKFSEIEKETNWFISFDLYINSMDNDMIDNILKRITSNKDSIEQLKNYLSFGIQNHLYIRSDNDSIPCTFYHLEQTGNVNNTYHAILSFENPEKRMPEHDFKVILHKSTLFSETVEFLFKKEDILKLPELTF